MTVKKKQAFSPRTLSQHRFDCLSVFHTIQKQGGRTTNVWRSKNKNAHYRIRTDDLVIYSLGLTYE